MITAIKFTGYSDSQIELKQAGLNLLNEALLDPEFQQLWGTQTCTENKGLTQLEILQLLRTDCGVEFRAYRKWYSKVIGYFISGDVLWDNLKYLDTFKSTASGSNDGHEVLHMKGFSHYFSTGYNSTNVPYTFNRVFENWAYNTQFVPKTYASSAAETNS